MSSDTHPRDGRQEAQTAQRSERVWVFVDSHGGPDLVEYTVRVSEQEYQLGMHYDKGMALARENDFTAIKAFDQMDPAGKLLTKLMEHTAVKTQQVVPGPDGLPVWDVPLTVDMTLSATIRARGADAAEAEEVARRFAANEGGFELFSLDDGNYRGASDFYCGDRSAIQAAQDIDPDDDAGSGEVRAAPRQR